MYTGTPSTVITGYFCLLQEHHPQPQTSDFGSVALHSLIKDEMDTADAETSSVDLYFLNSPFGDELDSADLSTDQQHEEAVEAHPAMAKPTPPCVVDRHKAAPTPPVVMDRQEPAPAPPKGIDQQEAAPNRAGVHQLPAAVHQQDAVLTAPPPSVDNDQQEATPAPPMVTMNMEEGFPALNVSDELPSLYRSGWYDRAVKMIPGIPEPGTTPLGRLRSFAFRAQSTHGTTGVVQVNQSYSVICHYFHITFVTVNFSTGIRLYTVSFYMSLFLKWSFVILIIVKDLFTSFRTSILARFKQICSYR